MQKTKNLTRCDFCRYWTGSSCMVTPSAYYCKDANNEFYAYLQNKKNPQQVQKSLKPWDKNR